MTKQTFFYWFLMLYCALVGVFILLPILSSFVFSFNYDRFPSIPLGDFSTRWYEYFAEDEKNFTAIYNTLLIALATSVTATIIGFTAAYTDYRYRFKGKPIYLALVLIPPTVPLVILGLAFLSYFSILGISGSLANIWLSHSVITIPFAMALFRLRLSQMDANLESAAWNLGANEYQSLFTVVIPFVFPAIIASLLISMAISFDEFAIAWFISGINETLPIRVLNFLQGQVSPRINVIGTLTFTTTIVMVLGAQYVMLKTNKSTVV